MRTLVASALILAAMPAHALTVLLYSRVDAAQAEEIRSIARAYDTVWFDGDLRPGDEWRPTVAEQISRADTILILWSQHAARSPEIAAEWRMALASKARVIPVLLDATALPPELALRHWIDWRGHP